MYTGHTVATYFGGQAKTRTGMPDRQSERQARVERVRSRLQPNLDLNPHRSSMSGAARCVPGKKRRIEKHSTATSRTCAS
eukprot:1863780-Prymnesium_polylepis.1